MKVYDVECHVQLRGVFKTNSSKTHWKILWRISAKDKLLLHYEHGTDSENDKRYNGKTL